MIYQQDQVFIPLVKSECERMIRCPLRSKADEVPRGMSPRRHCMPARKDHRLLGLRGVRELREHRCELEIYSA